MFRMPLLAVAVTSLSVAVASPAVATATQPPLLSVAGDGRLTSACDALPPDLPIRVSPDAAARSAAAGRVSPAAASAVERQIAGMRSRGWISDGRASRALADWRSAVASSRRARGAAGASLGNALRELSTIATGGSFTPSRLQLVTLTATRNAEFFGRGRTAAPYQRVRFEGSDLVWQHYPGKGLQLQVLASFGVANGLWRAGRKGQLGDLLDELAALASKRAGGIAWEYGFGFGGGSPPWASGMAQATGAQAMSRGAALLGNARYARIARSALPLFDRPPPSGVRLATRRGPWYLMYSFAPPHRILNGFLQSLVALDEVRDLTGDTHADRLFRAGDPVARAALPSFRSPGWSFYAPGRWHTDAYHSLTTGFLEELCRRTGATAYCSTGRDFRRLLTTAPTATILTSRLAARRSGSLAFRVSKPAVVTLTVTRGRPQVAPAPGGGAAPAAARPLARFTRAVVPGDHRFRFSPPAAGAYTARLTATDGGGRSRTVVVALTATRR